MERIRKLSSGGKRLKVLILLGKGEVYFPGKKKKLKIQIGSRGMRVDLGRGHWLF